MFLFIGMCVARAMNISNNKMIRHRGLKTVMTEDGLDRPSLRLVGSQQLSLYVLKKPWNFSCSPLGRNSSFKLWKPPCLKIKHFRSIFLILFQRISRRPRISSLLQSLVPDPSAASILERHLLHSGFSDGVSADSRSDSRSVGMSGKRSNLFRRLLSVASCSGKDHDFDFNSLQIRMSKKHHSSLTKLTSS